MAANLQQQQQQAAAARLGWRSRAVTRAGARRTSAYAVSKPTRRAPTATLATRRPDGRSGAVGSLGRRRQIPTCDDIDGGEASPPVQRSALRAHCDYYHVVHAFT